MACKWGAMNVVERKPTGKYYKALIGPCAGQIGEAVKFWAWGGLDLALADGTIVTFANDDVEEYMMPSNPTMADLVAYETAKLDGRLAHMEGANRADCPYPPEKTLQYRGWILGWEERSLLIDPRSHLYDSNLEPTDAEKEHMLC